MDACDDEDDSGSPTGLKEEGDANNADGDEPESAELGIRPPCTAL